MTLFERLLMCALYFASAFFMFWMMAYAVTALWSWALGVALL